MKRKVSIVIMFFLLLGMIPQNIFAESSGAEFSANALIKRVDSADKFRVDYINDYMLDSGTVNEVKKSKSAAIPSKYSLVSQLPPARDQLDTGTCWAFAALASLESNMIKKGLSTPAVDFSEYHLAWFSFNGKSYGTDSLYAGQDSYVTESPYDDGGNSYMAGATLARWYGAVKQGLASNPLSLSNDIKNRSDVHVEDVNWLTVPHTIAARNSIKRYIMENGAITIGYCHHDSCYNEYTNIHYCRHGDRVIHFRDAGYHDVSVVGWDDSKNAWLVRNSWGREWGQDGYFYLSYNDTTILDMFGYQTGKNAKKYNYIYQYDGVGFGDTLLYDTKLTLSANRYTAHTDINVKAVGTYAVTADSQIYVRIFLNPVSGKPNSGKKLYEKTYSVSRAGYHILEIDKNIYIPKGHTYSVVVRGSFYDDGQKYYPVLNELKLVGKNYCTIDYSTGQSYIYKNGAWKDVKKMKYIYDPTYGDYYDAGNALAKALAVKTGSKSQTLKLSKYSYKKVNGCKAFNLNAEVTKGTGSLYYKSSNPSVVSVSSTGTVSVKKPGKATITVTAAPNKTYKSASKKVSITVTPSKVTLKSVASKKGKITIAWNKVANADGYHVVAAQNKDFTKDKRFAIITKNSITARTFTGMASGKKYYAKVRAYKIVDGKRIYGSYSNTKYITIK